MALAPAALGQTQPPNPTAPPAPAPAPATAPAAGGPGAPAAPAAPAVKAPPYQFTFAPAYGNLDIRGSREDYFHYNHPPSGFYADLLQLTHRDPAGFSLGQVWWRNLGQADHDQKGYLDAHSRDMPAFLRLWRNSAHFYGDPQFLGGPVSDRRDTRVQARLEQLPPSAALDLFYWGQRVSVPAIARLAPSRGIDSQTTEYALRGTLPVGAGKISLEPRHLTFDDHTGSQPDSSTVRLAADWEQSAGRRAGVSAGVDHVTTKVSGQGTATWNIVRLQGTLQSSRSLFVDAFYRQQNARLPFTLTTYANRSALVGVNVSAYPWRHSSLRGGVFHEDLRRIDGDTGSTERPAWTGGWADFRFSRLGPWNFDVRLREKDLDRAPATAISALPSTATLYYTRDRSVDARLDGFLGERVNPYLLYTWRERHNADRGTALTLNSATLGATGAVSSRLSLTAEFTHQRWSGDTAPFIAPDGSIDPNLPPSLFFSNSGILTGNLAYQLDTRSSLTLSYNHFLSSGGQSAHDQLAILEYRRDVSRSFFYSVGYQYEDFSDSRLDRSYRASPFLLQLGLRRDFD